MAICKIEGKKGVSWAIDFYDKGKRFKKVVGSKQEAKAIQRLMDEKKRKRKRAVINRKVERIGRDIDPISYAEEILRKKVSNSSTLRNIISGKWITIPPSDLKLMRFPGVYIVSTSKKKHLYVGTGKILKNRIANKDHIFQIKEKARELGIQKSELKELIFQVRIDKKNLERFSLEQQVIKLLKPMCNGSRKEV